MERTFVMLKPDCVQRRLLGEIIARFERANLKIVGLKMVLATKELIKLHYPETDDWFISVGNKTLTSYKEYGLDPIKDLGTDDPLEIGKIVKNWLLEYITSGPVICMVIEGNRAIENVRRIVGHTIPTFAVPGSIRGDFSVDSPDLANRQKRPIRNLVHASGDKKEAEHEIKLWFKESELYDYKLTDD